MFCKLHDRYVSLCYCEIINDGKKCEYHNNKIWNSVKELKNDELRPKEEVDIIRPKACHVNKLMERKYYDRPQHREWNHNIAHTAASG